MTAAIGRLVTHRWTERLLLALAAVALLLAADSLGRAGFRQPSAPWVIVATYLALVLVAQLALTVVAPRSDQALLPLTALLSGLGLLYVMRLEPDFADRQIVWHGLGIALLVVVTPLLGDVQWLRRYKYSAALSGLVLMGATALFGQEINGSRLWLGVGGYNFQVTEAMKVLLVLFLAAYLADRRVVLAAASRRWRGVRLPTLPYLLPLGIVWVLTFLVLIWQRDLGATLLLAGVTLLLVYIASGRLSFVLFGVALVLVDVYVAYHLFGYVRDRVDVWLHPFLHVDGPGYQMVQALYALAHGSVFGTGIGQGLPTYIPAVHTDFVFAAMVEELGMVGAFGIVLLYLLFVYRGLMVAVQQTTDFTRLLAAGCTLVIAVQTIVIMAGNTGLAPLTGITLPFVSYGGSSLLMNYVILAILLRLSARRPLAPV